MTTKDRILNAAERLFAQNGVEATSLRSITTQASVNLAAVNYHFQSKESLIHAVIARRLDPVNEQRLAMLDACEAAAGDGPLPLEPVLDALLRPIFEMLSGQAKEFTPIMGRIFTESAELTEKVFQKHLAHVARRFMPAFQRALPDLPPVELLWRLQFVFGVMSHTMGAGRIVQFISKGQCDTTDVEATVKRVETFLLAGLRAPVPAPAEVEHAAH
ncbi:MAG TPA: TetR/AcrR family transcriptional regulator [Bryobacteraceae bacterium]|jgi:AcrR family transcriptional regulator|nr:TetR/AcrR family transcriptional regulator [Bryobacteraceae bacterium]